MPVDIKYFHIDKLESKNEMSAEHNLYLAEVLLDEFDQPLKLIVCIMYMYIQK